MPFTPLDAARICLRRARRSLRMAQANLPDSRVKNDLRRMSLVMGVTAIDAFMHRAVLAEISSNRATTGIPKSLRSLGVSFGELVDLAEQTVKARQRGTVSRPWVQVKNALDRQLLRETIQSFDQIGRAMAMLGVSNGWQRIAGVLGETPEHIKTRLNSIVHRRNQIVHEGDFLRLVRPRKLRFNKVLHKDIENDIKWIGQLITVIHSILT